MAQRIDFGVHMNFLGYYSKHVDGFTGSGDQRLGRCRFHEDSRPSLSVNIVTGLWYCQAEGRGGNVVDFHAELNGISKSEAFKELCRIYNIPLDGAGSRSASKRQPVKQKSASANRKPAPPKERPTIKKEEYEKFDPIPDDLVEHLKETRGWSKETIIALNIRLDSHYFAKTGKATRRKKRDETGRIAIPIRNSAGEIINIRRYLPSDAREWAEERHQEDKKAGKRYCTPTAKMISVKAGYGGDAMLPSPSVVAKSGKTVFIVEGEPDLLCALSLGVNACTRTGKKHDWTDEEKEAFKGKHVVLAFDADQAGERFCDATARVLRDHARATYKLHWPEFMGRQENGKWPAKGGQDLTDFFKRHKKTLKEFNKLLQVEINFDPIPYDENKSNPSPPPQKREPDPRIAETLKRANELNKKHAVVRIGGSVRVMSEDLHPVTHKTDINFLTIGDFKAFYANEKVLDPETEKYTGIGHFWLSWPERRQYEGLVFEPGQTNVEGYYNLYRGFACEPAKGDWSLFRRLIEEIIANGKPSRAQYILAWMARIVQDPGGERPGVSIVMRGRQGTGKGTFANIFGSLFGPHYQQIAQPEQVLGRFNSHLKEALVVFVDEGFWAGNKQAEGVIKNMITEPEINIEQKGKDIFTIRNHINMLIASNNSWVIPAGLEERRFLVIDVPDSRMQDHEYFSNIYKQMNNGGREAMLHDLLSLDISGINLRKIERTEGLFDQQLASMDTLQKFWYGLLREGSLDPNYGFWTGETPLGVLYQHYKNFCDDMNDRYKLAIYQFSREIRKMCKGIRQQRPRVKNDGHDEIKKDRRIAILFFPSLDDCRRQFEDLVRMKISWEDEDENPKWMSENGRPELGTTGVGNWDRLGHPEIIPN